MKDLPDDVNGSLWEILFFITLPLPDIISMQASSSCFIISRSGILTNNHRSVKNLIAQPLVLRFRVFGFWCCDAIRPTQACVDFRVQGVGFWCCDAIRSTQACRGFASYSLFSQCRLC